MMWTARTRANMEGFGFHDCRHHFVSVAVMSGIDYLTIARWVGHKDGGILIGKVYGHLSAEHLKKAAMRLSFRSTESTELPTHEGSSNRAPQRKLGR